MNDGGEGVLTRWANYMVGNNPKAMAQRGRSEEADAPPYVPPPAPQAKPALRFFDGGSMGGVQLGELAPAPQQLRDPNRQNDMLAAAGRVQSYQPLMPAGGGLQFADGGMFGKLFGSSKPPETITEKYARQDAERAAKAAKAAPAPAAPAASAPAQGGALNPANALKAREKAAGLRDGGQVPGTGTGDKIPALYTPGEFVVSKAMLKRSPGLRDALHELRADTLAAEGKTVEEADAEAVRGMSLRAARGYDEEDEQAQKVLPGNAAQRPGASSSLRGGLPPVGGVGGANSLRDTTLSPTGGVFPGTRAVGRGFAEDAASALREPKISDKVGKFLHAAGRATLAAPLGLVEDVLEPAVRFMEPVTTGVTQATNTAVTGESAAVQPVAAPALRPQPAQAPYTAPAPDRFQRSLRQGMVPGAEEGAVTRKGNSFSGTNVSNYGAQNVIPGMDRALIEQTLTNPDGSRWTDADNSRMAANLRAGADPYAGTSRAPVRDPLAEATAERYGTPGRKSRIAAAQALRSDETLRRGQDVELGRAQMTARTAREAGARDQFNKDREFGLNVDKFGNEAASAEQTRSYNARNNLAKELQVFGPDNKVDDAGSAAALAMVQKIMPGADQLTGEALSKNLSEMKALAKVFGRAYQNPQQGVAKLNPFDPKAPALDSLPDWKGGKLVKDGVTGLVTPGSGMGNYYIEVNGVKTPLGKDLSEREIEIINHVTKTGDWLGAPKKTQKGN